MKSKSTQPYKEYYKEFDNLLTEILFDSRWAFIDENGDEDGTSEMNRPLSDEEVLKVKKDAWFSVGCDVSYSPVKGIFSIFSKNTSYLNNIVLESGDPRKFAIYVVEILYRLRYKKYSDIVTDKKRSTIIDMTTFDIKYIQKVFKIMVRYRKDYLNGAGGGGSVILSIYDTFAATVSAKSRNQNIHTLVCENLTYLHKIISESERKTK